MAGISLVSLDLSRWEPVGVLALLGVGGYFAYKHLAAANGAAAQQASDPYAGLIQQASELSLLQQAGILSGGTATSATGTSAANAGTATTSQSSPSGGSTVTTTATGSGVSK
jgi:predicted negative regulator of RcsB-dependent stress response